MCIQFKTLLLNILLYQLVRCLFKAAGYDGKPINNKRPLLKGLLKYLLKLFSILLEWQIVIIGR